MRPLKSVKRAGWTGALVACLTFSQGVLAEALPAALVRLPRTLLHRHTVQPTTVALWRQMDADRQRRRAIPTLSIG